MDRPEGGFGPSMGNVPSYALAMATLFAWLARRVVMTGDRSDTSTCGLVFLNVLCRTWEELSGGAG